MMYESLARLAALPPSTLVYCAHEYTLSNLRFARAAEPANEATSLRLQEAESIRQRDLETVPSTLAIEFETNPFLRVDQPSVRETVGRRLGKDVDLGDAVAVFTRLRQWKNEFS
jgi:hydroxyacylglutathione hydrolase